MATAPFVLDNSVLCGWILANQATVYGDAVATQLAQAVGGCASHPQAHQPAAELSGPGRRVR